MTIRAIRVCAPGIPAAGRILVRDNRAATNVARTAAMASASTRISPAARARPIVRRCQIRSRGAQPNISAFTPPPAPAVSVFGITATVWADTSNSRARDAHRSSVATTPAMAISIPAGLRPIFHRTTIAVRELRSQTPRALRGPRCAHRRAADISDSSDEGGSKLGNPGRVPTNCWACVDAGLRTLISQ